MKIKHQIQTALCTAVIVVCSMLPSIPLPFSPVPVTLQTFAIFTVSILLGLRAAVAAVALYLAMGALGLPVFAQMRGGIDVLIGPRGGYLIGFLFAAAALGLASDLACRYAGPIRKTLILAAGSLVGITAIYTIGTLQLARVLNLQLEQALAAGTLPFILPDLVKMALALAIGLAVRQRVEKPNRAQER